MKTKKSNWQRYVSIILYAAPLLFFLIAYFTMVVAGEDIYQGANTTPNVFQDALSAFNWSARLSDMYGMSVINFFDYQYSFGIDTIFRLIDTIVGMGIVYLITSFILGYRPKLNLPNSTLFGLVFLALILLAPNFSSVFLGGFSLIHNYLFIIGSGLLFAWIFFRTFKKYQNLTPTKRRLMVTLALLVGLIFGLSHNLTPIAFLLCLIIYLICSLRHRPIKQLVNLARVVAILGVISGIAITFCLGPGVSGYASGGYATAYDYISFSQIFAEPLHSVHRIAIHWAQNTYSVLIPFLPFLLAIGCYIGIHLKVKSLTLRPWSAQEKNTLLVTISFLFCYLLTNSQISAPARVLVPAFICMLILTLVIIRHYLANSTDQHYLPLACLIFVIVMEATGAKLIYSIGYNRQISTTLQSIRDSSDTSLCINRSDVATPNTSEWDFRIAQDAFLTDWILPANIDGKTITFCEQL